MARATRSSTARTAPVKNEVQKEALYPKGKKRSSDHNSSKDSIKPAKKAKKQEIKQDEIKKEVDEALHDVLPSLQEKYDRSTLDGTLPADISMTDSKPYLKAKKLKTHANSTAKTPFPDFPRPTSADAKLAYEKLSKIHGPRVRPKVVVANRERAGCGDSPSVLDALVRTILSQNTSDVNSSRAKKSMDQTYGGSDEWESIVEGGQAKLEEAIACGGLSKVKSKVILNILETTKEKYGRYSLDHMFDISSEEAVSEMISFKGVGIKTAACVMLFCLQKDSFPVDTHVHRITGLLNWRPTKANRDETFYHLDSRIPDELKYGLHVLLVTHGKRCDECKAGGKAKGNCELRKAFK